MAEIMKLKEFGQVYGNKLNKEHVDMIRRMKPGESMVIAFRTEDIVFVRVTAYHIATMSVYEFNGIE